MKKYGKIERKVTKGVKQCGCTKRIAEKKESEDFMQFMHVADLIGGPKGLGGCPAPRADTPWTGYQRPSGQRWVPSWSPWATGGHFPRGEDPLETNCR